jgi:cytochrome c556
MSMPVIRLKAAIGTTALLALLCSCSSKEASAPAAPPVAANAAASMLDLMRDPIASNAEALWNAVGTVSTETGSKDLAPGTDAEWAAVRLKATGLMEAADQLATPGRVVAHPDQKLKDPAGPGDLTPAQAQAAIEKGHAAFATFAGVLKNAAGALVAAIDKRDVEAYQTAGGALDEACEVCHKRYWYPESAAPPVP